MVGIGEEGRTGAGAGAGAGAEVGVGTTPEQPRVNPTAPQSVSGAHQEMDPAQVAAMVAAAGAAIRLSADATSSGGMTNRGDVFQTAAALYYESRDRDRARERDSGIGAAAGDGDGGAGGSQTQTQTQVTPGIAAPPRQRQPSSSGHEDLEIAERNVSAIGGGGEGGGGSGSRDGNGGAATCPPPPRVSSHAARSVPSPGDIASGGVNNGGNHQPGQPTYAGGQQQPKLLFRFRRPLTGLGQGGAVVSGSIDPGGGAEQSQHGHGDGQEAPRLADASAAAVDQLDKLIDNWFHPSAETDQGAMASSGSVPQVGMIGAADPGTGGDAHDNDDDVVVLSDSQ